MSVLNRDEATRVNSPTLASPSSISSVNNPFPASTSSSSSKSYDSNSPSFRFRRHSSQSSLPQVSHVANPNLVSPLTIASTSAAIGGGGGGDRSICSSPINSLKMSSRVCQLKIDEGIELHLSREIKSERDTQSTLKLKTSCDELMLNSDSELIIADMLCSFETAASSQRTNTPSPSQATFRRYRTFSESLNNQPTMTNVVGTVNAQTMVLVWLNINLFRSFNFISGSKQRKKGIFENK